MKRPPHLMLAAVGALSLLCASASQAQSYSASMRYPNPNGDMNLFRNKPCRDPWVTIALQIVHGRANAGACLIALYNNGRWNDFNQLVHAVAATKKTLDAQGLSIRAARVEGSRAIVAVLVDNRAGGRIVAAGGGNVVSTGGNGLIGPDGATLIGNDAGSLVGMNGNTLRSTPSFAFSTGYSLQGSRVVRLPGGNALVVK